MACGSCSGRPSYGGGPVPTGPDVVTVWYAIGPDGTEKRSTTKYGARAHARAGGGTGWTVVPRKERRNGAPAPAEA